MKDRYLIGECPHCRTLIIADSRYKNKTCPSCNARIPLDELNVIRTAGNSRKAREIISDAKARRGGLNQR